MISASAISALLSCSRDASGPVPKHGVVFVCEHGGAIVVEFFPKPGVLGWELPVWRIPALGVERI
jgi:hypothetical protein